MENSKPYGTVLIRAAHILDYLADHPDLSLQQLSRGTEMTASTTLKILDTLVLIGYVNKNQDKTYRLGSKLIRYANKNIDQLDLVELSLPYLEQLQKSIDETIHLGILNNAEILYVNKLEPKIKRFVCRQKSESPGRFTALRWEKLCCRSFLRVIIKTILTSTN